MSTRTDGLSWERRMHLLGKHADELTDDELTALLTDRYGPTPVPACRVCGARLTLASIGGGSVTYACSGVDHVAADGRTVYRPGRSIADDHYARSRVEVHALADRLVIELIRRFTRRDQP